MKRKGKNRREKMKKVLGKEMNGEKGKRKGSGKKTGENKGGVIEQAEEREDKERNGKEK